MTNQIPLNPYIIYKLKVYVRLSESITIIRTNYMIRVVIFSRIKLSNTRIKLAHFY